MNEAAIDYLQQAITLMGKPDYDTAGELVKKFIQLEPRYKEAFSVLGDIYVNQDELEKALEAFQTMMTLDPDDAETMCA